MGDFFSVMYGIVASLVSFLQSCSFVAFGITVNPFAISIAVIVLSMVLNQYYKGARG